jgi:hypothetical protein
MNKNFLVLIVGALVAAFLAGRYSAPERVTEDKENSSLAIENTRLKKLLEENTEKLTELERSKDTLKIERPDGTTITRTHSGTKKRSNEHVSKIENLNQVSSSESSISSRDKKVIENRRGVNVSVLAGAPLTDFSYGLVYGASVSKQFLGPFSLGAWAFTDLRLGLSLGMEF